LSFRYLLLDPRFWRHGVVSRQGGFLISIPWREPDSLDAND